MPSSEIEELRAMVERLNRMVMENERELENIRASGLEFFPGRIKAGNRSVEIDSDGVSLLVSGDERVRMGKVGIALKAGSASLDKITFPVTLPNTSVRGDIFVSDASSDTNRPRMFVRSLPADSNDGDLTLSVEDSGGGETGINIDHSDSDDGDISFYVNTLANVVMFIDQDEVGIGTVNPAAMLHVDQSASDGAKPVLTLDQADIDLEFIKLVGSSEDSTADRSLVDVADMTTPGALVGWFQVYIEDVQATNPIADGVYYVPFYAAPSA